MHLFDQTDLIVVFHWMLRDGATYITEENEASEAKKREEAVQKKIAQAKEAASKVKNRKAKAEIKQAALQAKDPYPVELHPSVMISTLPAIL